MYENEAKQQKEKVINGNVYYTYWGGNEVCAMWKDVKGKMMEQCFLCGRKNELEVGFTLIEMIVCFFSVITFLFTLTTFKLYWNRKQAIKRVK